MTAHTPIGDRYLRRPQVEERVGLKKTAIYKYIREGTFPRPERLRGGRSVRWRASAIDAWMEDQSSG